VTDVVSRTADAVEALNAGAVVGLPTDTVYGLAVRIDRPGAAEELSEAKMRPAQMPLQVLVSGIEQARSLGDWTEDTLRIADRLWPGAVTLVVPGAGAPPSAGETVGLRWPAYSVVTEICDQCGPRLATSANRHGEPPITTAAAVAAAFPGSVAVVLDGGTCSGLASTVVDLTALPPRVLRVGSVSEEAVERAIQLA
jgi:L-threonylcarbamoyladenylate synthase